MKDKSVMRCIERLSDGKNHKYFFKIKKVYASAVPNQCLCFFGDEDSVNLSQMYRKIGDCKIDSVFCKVLGDCSQLIIDINTPVYVILFCFTEKTYMPINLNIEYGRYSYSIFLFINKFLKR